MTKPMTPERLQEIKGTTPINTFKENRNGKEKDGREEKR